MMKKIIFFLLFLAAASPAWAVTVSDDFNRADANPLAPNWDTNYNSDTARNCQIVSNVVSPSTINKTCFQTWNANSFSGDQTALLITTSVDVANGSTEAGVLVKGSASPTRTFYRCRALAAGGSRIDKIVSGSQTEEVTEDASGAWVSTDELKCTATGTTTVAVSLYKNGSLLLSWSDSSSPLSGSRIGISCFGVTGTVECQIDSFSGGDLGAAAPQATNRRAVMFE